MPVVPYNRMLALDYAHKWALGRNPAYLDFENICGDCTNFASQVVFAGSGTMNFTPATGWYYVNAYNRTPSWTGVEYLYGFLTGNEGPGPYAKEVDIRDIQAGDLLQLSFEKGHYGHSPAIVLTGHPPAIDNILVAAHTDNVDWYKLTGYSWVDIRFIHIMGVRK